MSSEIQETDFVRLDKKEVGQLKSFYANAAVSNVVGVWKQKSVSIKSPKSGRIWAKRTPKDKEKGNNAGFFSRMLDDFKKVKASDFTYQQSSVRKNSSYKPFWATKIQPNEDKKPIEDEVIKTTTSVVEASNVVRNKTLVFEKAVLGSPKVILTREPENVKKSPLVKKLSTVETSKQNALRMPPSYNGSQMRMPTGEQLFWVCDFNLPILLIKNHKRKRKPSFAENIGVFA